MKKIINFSYNLHLNLPTTNVFMCVCMYCMNVCMHIYECACNTCVCQYWVSSITNFSWNRVRHCTWSSSNLARLASWTMSSGIHLSWPSSFRAIDTCYHTSYMGAGNLNSGPHACMAGTLQTWLSRPVIIHITNLCNSKQSVCLYPN